MMKEECADRLLKALEEPAENTVFLLTAENDDRILATIASRCRIIRFLSENQNETVKAKEIKDEVFSLLCTIKAEPLEYLFRTAERYAKERELLSSFFETAASLFSENYLYRQGGYAPAHCFPAENWSNAQLFDLWQWALSAPILLESNINLKLITENFLLCIKRKEDPNGNCSWYTF
jgi:ribosomal protein L17